MRLGMTANGCPGMPDTWAITCAVVTKRSVMMAVAMMPACSARIASCILHDEQLPQSPTAEMTASQPCIAASTGAGTGRLKSSLRRRTTSRTPYCERSILSMWSSNGRTLILPLSKRPIVRPASDVSLVVAPAFAGLVSTVGSKTRTLISLVSLHRIDSLRDRERLRPIPGGHDRRKSSRRTTRGDHQQVLWRAQRRELLVRSTATCHDGAFSDGRPVPPQYARRAVHILSDVMLAPASRDEEVA